MSLDNKTYGEESIEVLKNHYGVEKPAKRVQGGEFTKTPLIISPVVHKEYSEDFFTNKTRLRNQIGESRCNYLIPECRPMNLSPPENIPLLLWS